MARAKARGIVSIDEAEPPAAIVLDTSAVVEFLLPSQPAHRHWQEFFGACAEQSTVMVFNELLEVELYDVLFNIALIERWGKGAAHGPKRYDGRVRRRAARLLGDYRREWQRFLDSRPTATVELARVVDRAPELIGSYGMRSNDAAHAGSALLTECAIATTDTGFATLPEEDLTILADPLRLAAMRRRRGQSARR